jgi:3-hydroxybutyryl-CoA dehydrogenase
MHILVIDGGHVEAEFREKFGPAHEYSFFSSNYANQAEQDLIAPQIQAIGQIADVAFCCESAQSYGFFIGQPLPVFAEASVILWPKIYIGNTM